MARKMPVSADRLSAVPVRVLIASDSLAFMDAYVAKGARLFDLAGLDVTWLPLVDSADLALSATVAGQCDVVNAATLYVLASADERRALKIFAGGALGITSLFCMSKTQAERAVSRGITPGSPIIDRLRALRGLRIGTGSVGGATERNVRVALQSVGVDPDSDVELVSGTSQSQLQAFRVGQIDVSVQGVLYTLQAVMEGAGVIWISGPNGDIPQWNKGYFLCWATSELFATSHPEVIERFINGLRMASEMIRDDREGALNALQVSFPHLDRQLISRAFDAQRRAYAIDPVVKKPIMQDVIDIYSVSAETKVELRPEDLVLTGWLAP